MTRTYHLTTLGCAKNQVDSEKLEAMLAEAGYEPASSSDQADVVMVNTCAFIEEARRESVETILDLGNNARPGSKTVVLGCMAQRFGVEVEKALPEVDAVIGLDRYGGLVETLDRLTGWEPVRIRSRPTMDILHRVDRARPAYPYSYLKVAEGCDKPCTFCAIPLIRGKQRSRPPVEIRNETERLVQQGVREVVLVAQDLASYGRDLERKSRPGIVELLKLMSRVDGLDRLRLLYLYPREISGELIEEIASNPRIATYFDLSLQHATTRLLRSMKRPGGVESYMRLIDRIRRQAPDAALRSSFIVGFPGEEDADVEELADFLGWAKLDWAGFFPYSPEEGTPASTLPGRVPEVVVAERLRHLQEIQEEITAAANLESVGSRLGVLIDQVEDGVPLGRSYRQAPEIDGVIALDAGSPGTWVEAEVTAAYGPDLEARVVSGR
ncbi:MAG: 30S ribosomal protein S12 methylthiotransferase RimO [Acidimicrobiia bacterium]